MRLIIFWGCLEEQSSKLTRKQAQLHECVDKLISDYNDLRAENGFEWPLDSAKHPISHYNLIHFARFNHHLRLLKLSIVLPINPTFRDNPVRNRNHCLSKLYVSFKRKVNGNCCVKLTKILSLHVIIISIIISNANSIVLISFLAFSFRNASDDVDASTNEAKDTCTIFIPVECKFVGLFAISDDCVLLSAMRKVLQIMNWTNLSWN